jgi:protein phosphatase
MKLNYIYSSRTGLRRETNEDFVDVFEVDDGILAIVCDGLGGNNAGEVASKLAVQTIYNYFLEKPDQEYLERLTDAISEANSEIARMALSSSDYRGMATTVVALFLNQQHAIWGHVGDSRIYYWEPRGITQITKDHSLVQKLLDDGFITLKEAENHPHKNVIMRALGEKTEIQVDGDVFPIEKNKQWKLLLCTDGVSNVITKNELHALLLTDDLEIISKQLSLAIDERGAPDNYSYVIINHQLTN